MRLTGFVIKKKGLPKQAFTFLSNYFNKPFLAFVHLFLHLMDA